MAEPIYKVLTEAAFRQAKRDGRFAGSADDLRDGFVHLSARHQLPGTLATHFQARTDLVLVAIDAERLGEDLKWEPSRSGALFPHLYAALDFGAVLWAAALPLGNDGRHVLPEGIAA
jgi:uncharacterized protein (DUF952 family)